MTGQRGRATLASCDDTVVGVETVSSFPIFGVDAVDFGVVEAVVKTAVTNSAPKAAVGGSLPVTPSPARKWLLPSQRIVQQRNPWKFGGRGGIRTPGCLATSPDFESGTFNHSVTLPLLLQINGLRCYATRCAVIRFISVAVGVNAELLPVNLLAAVQTRHPRCRPRGAG